MCAFFCVVLIIFGATTAIIADPSLARLIVITGAFGFLHLIQIYSPDHLLCKCGGHFCPRCSSIHWSMLAMAYIDYFMRAPFLELVKLNVSFSSIIGVGLIGVMPIHGMMSRIDQQASDDSKRLVGTLFTLGCYIIILVLIAMGMQA